MKQNKIDNDRDLLALLYELAKAVRFCHQEEICGEGITFVQFNILNCVYEAGTLRLADLHEMLKVDRSTTTRLVAPLVKKGLVNRSKSSTDSRAIELRLTAEGEQTRNRAWECLRGFINLVVQGIPEQDMAGILKSVRIFAAAVQNASNSEPCCQLLPR